MTRSGPWVALPASSPCSTTPAPSVRPPRSWPRWPTTAPRHPKTSSASTCGLRKQGWQIDNVTGPGEEGRYRMVSGDNRLRVKLSPQQLAALQRAVILSNRSDLAKRLGVQPGSLTQRVGSDVLPHEESKELSRSLQAVQLSSRIRFSYKDPTRRSPRHGALPELPVVPQRDRRRRRQGQALRREPHARGLPRQAQHRTSVPAVRRIPLHPLCWEIDPPTQATIRASPEYVPDVTRWLMEPDSRKEHDGVADMTYTVTNRAAFRARIYVLGPRATLVGPDDLRDEMLSPSSMVGL